jgi:PAS domain S-box-containing protein
MVNPAIPDEEMSNHVDEDLRRMSKVFRDAADPILIEDLDGIVIEMNGEAEASYGWSRDELMGKPIKTIVPPDRHGQADDALERCKAGEDVRNIEGLRCSKAGRVIPVLLTLSLLRDESGEPEAVATIAKDVSEQKQAEEELRDHQDHLEDMVKERTAELEKTMKQAQQFNKMAIDRELRMIELKKEINELLKKIGEEPKYAIFN